MRARWYVGRAQNLGMKEINMWQYIIPAASTIVVAVIEALSARDRSRAKKQAETLKPHELVGNDFKEVMQYCNLL